MVIFLVLCRYLTNVANMKDTVQLLLALAGLEKCETVRIGVQLVCDEQGELWAMDGDSDQPQGQHQYLERHKRVTSSLGKVVCQMKNERVVRKLLLRLPHYIDLSAACPRSKDMSSNVTQVCCFCFPV